VRNASEVSPSGTFPGSLGSSDAAPLQASTRLTRLMAEQNTFVFMTSLLRIRFEMSNERLPSKNKASTVAP
jgi:hypothetical protein